MWRVNLKIDGLSVDALVVACYPGCLRFNLAPDLGEVVEPPSRMVQELAPFMLPCDTGGRVWVVYLIMGRLVLVLARKVDELQNQRPPRNDAASSG